MSTPSALPSPSSVPAAAVPAPANRVDPKPVERNTFRLLVGNTIVTVALQIVAALLAWFTYGNTREKQQHDLSVARQAVPVLTVELGDGAFAQTTLNGVRYDVVPLTVSLANKGDSTFVLNSIQLTAFTAEADLVAQAQRLSVDDGVVPIRQQGDVQLAAHEEEEPSDVRVAILNLQSVGWTRIEKLSQVREPKVSIVREQMHREVFHLLIEAGRPDPLLKMEVKVDTDGGGDPVAEQWVGMYPRGVCAPATDYDYGYSEYISGSSMYTTTRVGEGSPAALAPPAEPAAPVEEIEALEPPPATEDVDPEGAIDRDRGTRFRRSAGSRSN